MRKFVVSSYDTSIYQGYPNVNTGFDEMLEVGKISSTNMGITTDPAELSYISSSTRALIKFDIDPTFLTGSGTTYILNLKVARGNELKNNQELRIGHVSQSWTEGSAYFFQQPYNKQDGATWIKATNDVNWFIPGGVFVSGSEISYVLSSYPIQDPQIDVSSIIRPILSQSQTFNGLYIKFTDSDELDVTDHGDVKFFSRETHTIHQPYLEVCWFDQTFITGTLNPLPVDDNTLIATNRLNYEYTKGSVERVRLVVRDKFVDRKFGNEPRFINKYYLPSASYFRITDVAAGTSFGQFDSFNTINCDGTSSYFSLDTSPLYRNRLYSIELQYSHDGIDRLITLPNSFTVR